MLAPDDSRWSSLTGGYKTRFDPRPLLARLEMGQDTMSAWHDLWEELHHQGDVGDASYAAVPQLVRIHRQRGSVDLNTYALVAIIESARTEAKNPQVPQWLEQEYFAAIRELAEIGTAEILVAEKDEEAQAILSVIAIAKGLRTHGRFLLEYSEDELLDMESR